MTVCVVLGDHSDIAQSLLPLMRKDDWHVAGWNRYTPGTSTLPHWDVCLIALGARTWVLNLDWHDDVRLFASAASVAQQGPASRG